MEIEPNKIVDERCKCGEFKSKHADAPSEKGGGPGPGDCLRFTWAAFVLEDGTDESNDVIPW